MNDMHHRLGVIEGKLDSLITTVEKGLVAGINSNNDHALRLRSLERWKSFLAGTWAVLTILFGLSEFKK